MRTRPKITLTLIDKRGECGCHRGHRVGDRFDFDTERGKLCPMAMHAAFPCVDILRYGGHVPPSRTYGAAAVCCPDPDVCNVFRIDVEEAGEAEK